MKRYVLSTVRTGKKPVYKVEILALEYSYDIAVYSPIATLGETDDLGVPHMIVEALNQVYGNDES